MLKKSYVGAVRVAAKASSAIGLLSALERRRDARTVLWMRSLFSIYDLDDLVHLDLAWWTFEAMDAVESFLKDRPGARVFEYGSGASTIWLARRSARVTSVEHDRAWGERMIERTQANGNIRIKIVPPVQSAAPRFASEVGAWRGYDFQQYVGAIDQESGTFDLIVVDGRCRVACLEHAANRLAEGGLLLFDNSNRQRYRDALESSSMRRVVTRGLVPGLPYPDETTLLSRPGEGPGASDRGCVVRK